MSKLYDRDGFCVFGTQPAATTLVANEQVYLIVDRRRNQDNLNEAQQLHMEGMLNVHDPYVDWRAVTDKKGKATDKGMLNVFPSIAQQWKNQMKGKYIKPKTYMTDNPDKMGEDKYWEVLKSYLERN